MIEIFGAALIVLLACVVGATTMHFVWIDRIRRCCEESSFRLLSFDPPQPMRIAPGLHVVIVRANSQGAALGLAQRHAQALASSGYSNPAFPSAGINAGGPLGNGRPGAAPRQGGPT